MSKKNMFMPEFIHRGEDGEITGKEDITLVTEDYSVKTQNTTLDKKLKSLDDTNLKEKERLDNVSKEVKENKTNTDNSISNLKNKIEDVDKSKWGKDELELGGRNYLTQKDQEKMAKYNDFITIESKQENGLYVHEIVTLTDVTVRAAIPVYDYKHFKEDDDITVSCDIKSTEELLVKLTQTTEDEYKVVKPNEWVRIHSKVDYGDRIGIYTENQATEGAVINVKNYKLEKGNIATPFSLAPEDEDKTSTQTSPLANLDHVDKVDKQVVENTKMKWGKDELELGGRNLMKGYPTNEKLNIKTKDNFYKDFNTQIKPQAGDIYTINFDFEVIEGDNMYFSIGTGENHYSRDIRNLKGLNDKPATFKVEERHIINENARIWVRFNRKNFAHDSEANYWNIKLEKGSIATPWTPAPEDLDGIQTQPAPLANMAHVEYLENQIKELKEMIALRGLSR